MMHSSQKCLDLIEKWEGKEYTVYEDVAGKRTVGIGHLLKAGEDFTTLTDEECYDLLRKDLIPVEIAINKWVKVPVTQNEYDAMCCLVYNIGTGNFLSSSVLRFLNEHQYEDAAEAFLMWCKFTKGGKKVVSQGLVNRRRDEMNLFLKE